MSIPGLDTGGDKSSPSNDRLLSDDLDLVDDVEVVFVDEDEDEESKPLRGQNEDSLLEDEDDASPADYDNPQFQERLSEARRQSLAERQQALEEQERTEYALLNSEKSKIAIQRDSFKLALDGVDVRIRTSTEALKYARQEGDTSAEIDLESQIQELRNIRGQIEQNMGRLPDEADLDNQFRAHIQSRRQRFQQQMGNQDDAPRPLNEKAGKWQKANKWMADPSKAKEKAGLIEVNNALVAEGYDANSDEFFTELSRRMAKRYPNLGVRSLTAQGVGQQARQPEPRQSAPVATARSTAPPSPHATQKKQRYQLNGDDVRMMRMFRIDPNDAAARKRYAEEKYRRLQSESQR